MLCWMKSEDRPVAVSEGNESALSQLWWHWQNDWDWLSGVPWLCFCEIQVLSCKWRLSCFAQVLLENIWSFTFSQWSYPGWLHFCRKQRRRSVLRLVWSFHFKSLAGSCSLLFDRQYFFKYGLCKKTSHNNMI